LRRAQGKPERGISTAIESLDYKDRRRMIAGRGVSPNPILRAL